MNKTAIILGASGLIGGDLLKQLLADPAFDKVTVFVRNSLNLKHPKLRQIITSFNDLEELKEEIKGDVLFSCLGSTKSKTPDLKEYKRIDGEIPLTFARFGNANAIKQFHIVSALGANSKSFNFYNQLKGEIEEEVKKIAFSSIHIYQPSLLRGDRKEKRILESLALFLTKFIDPLLFGDFKKYRSISASTIAKAMINQTKKGIKGIYTYPSDKIKELA